MSSEQNTKTLESLESLSSGEHYSNQIDGIYGTFSTPSGVVCYLQTKAKLGSDGSRNFQLTKALVPAREALNVKEMDFNQLLQRDLDDHRIATTLIPYILNPPDNQLPGFFPPIVAVILPFDHNQNPLEHFEPPIETVEQDYQYNLRFRMISHPGAYRIQHWVKSNNEPADIPLSVLRWNPETAKLVIMDGQHRAMSLLAIQRTVSNNWDSSPKGSRYRPFYEETIRKLLAQAVKNGDPIDLNKIELPVTICWFPERLDDSPRVRPHLAARKLFVDVNNTAKQPSEARMVLLSDTKLENILARELLNQLRRDPAWQDDFPLYGVEYDNPVAAVTTPRRWSVVTNLEILKDAVIRAVFGPEKLIQDMNSSLQGKPPLKDMDRFMRQQLRVSDLFPKEFHDGARLLYRERLGNDYFPLNDTDLLQKLLRSFYDTWGKGILYLFANVEPYKAHLKALRDRYNTWNIADNIQTLAKDALFEGVGMFWTIEDGHQLWLDQCKEAKEEKSILPPRPDVSKAWGILDGEQKTEFKKQRAEVLISSSQPEDIDDCDALFRSIISYAGQVGLILTWVSLCKKCANNENPFVVSKVMAKAINHVLAGGPNSSRNRKLILLKNSSKKGFKPLNTLPKLEPAYASYFRYFWLEIALFQTEDIWSELQSMDLTIARQMLDDARKVYIDLLINERKKLKMKDAIVLALESTQQASKAAELAECEIIEEQAQAHHYWFGGMISECRELIKNTCQRAPLITDDTTNEDSDGEVVLVESMESDNQI